MTAKTTFRQLMRERRAYAPDTPDHAYRTRAARKLVWVIRGVPVNEWAAQ